MTRAGNARVSVSKLVAEDDLVGRVEGDGSNLLQDLAVRPETIPKDQRSDLSISSKKVRLRGHVPD